MKKFDSLSLTSFQCLIPLYLEITSANTPQATCKLKTTSATFRHPRERRGALLAPEWDPFTLLLKRLTQESVILQYSSIRIVSGLWRRPVKWPNLMRKSPNLLMSRQVCTVTAARPHPCCNSTITYGQSSTSWWFCCYSTSSSKVGWVDGWSSRRLSDDVVKQWALLCRKKGVFLIAERQETLEVEIPDCYKTELHHQGVSNRDIMESLKGTEVSKMLEKRTIAGCKEMGSSKEQMHSGHSRHFS